MTREKDEERGERITNEVIVDAYTSDEQAISWVYYLERKMRFPFQARCVEERTVSPLKTGEKVRVVGMTDEVVSSHEMFVLVEWMNREFGIPLSQLEPIAVDDETREAIADWRYWNGDGGRL
jgi:hypothetical protein